MRLPRHLSDCVVFARWCDNHRRDGNVFNPAAVARLIALARRAKRAGETYHSVDRPGTQARYDAAMLAFERSARDLGYLATWPGLWPVLHPVANPAITIYLPDIA